MLCTAENNQEELLVAGGSRLVLDDRLVIRRLFLVTWLLAGAGVAAVCLGGFFGPDWVLRLGAKFNVDMENNVPTWFSTLLLVASSLVTAAAVAVSARSQAEQPVRRLFRMLAAVFLGMSLDEAASFHEHLQGPIKAVFHTGGFFHFAWVIPGAAFALLVGVWSMRGLRRLPSETRRGMVLAGAVYCAGAVGMEMISGKYLSVVGENRRDWGFGMLTVIEETLEMAGLVLFLRVMLRYLAKAPHPIVLVIGGAADEAEKVLSREDPGEAPGMGGGFSSGEDALPGSAYRRG
jgi:heme/copper-type cytochrome/quinol oxidase subunit 3